MKKLLAFWILLHHHLQQKGLERAQQTGFPWKGRVKVRSIKKCNTVPFRVNTNLKILSFIPNTILFLLHKIYFRLNLASILSTMPNQAVPSRTHSPTQQQNTCLTPSVTVVTPSVNPDGSTSNSLTPLIQPNPVFQPKPSTLAVPSLVGKTQAVSASKRAFLQV